MKGKQQGGGRGQKRSCAQLEGSSILSQNTNEKGTKWDMEEDCALLSAVTIYHTNWRRVSKALKKQFGRGRRSPEDCHARYDFLQSLQPRPDSLPWSPNEDLLLIYICCTHVDHWTASSELLDQRNAESIKARITNMVLETAQFARQGDFGRLGTMLPLEVLKTLFSVRLILAVLNEPETVPEEVRARIVSVVEETEVGEEDCTTLLTFILPSHVTSHKLTAKVVGAFLDRVADRLFVDFCTVDPSDQIDEVMHPRKPDADPEEEAIYVQPYYVVPTTYYCAYQWCCLNVCYVDLLYN